MSEKHAPTELAAFFATQAELHWVAEMKDHYLEVAAYLRSYNAMQEALQVIASRRFGLIDETSRSPLLRDRLEQNLRHVREVARTVLEGTRP